MTSRGLTPSAAPVRIFLIEDHPVVREGLAGLLEREGGFASPPPLLLADAAFLGLCRRLSMSADASGRDNPRAPLDEIEHHFAAWPEPVALPSSATTRPT